MHKLASGSSPEGDRKKQKEGEKGDEEPNDRLLDITFHVSIQQGECGRVDSNRRQTE